MANKNIPTIQTIRGNVGIGTTDPGNLLHIHASGNNASALIIEDDDRRLQLGRDMIESRTADGASVTALYIQPNGNTSFGSTTGNLGVGVTTPRAKFHAEAGSVSYEGTYNGRTTAVFENGSSGGSTISIMSQNTGYSGIFFGDTTLETRGQLQFEHSSDSFKFINGGGSERMRIDSSGNVGIGTTDPDYKLSVVGKINLNDGGFSVFIGELAGANDDGIGNYNVGVGYASLGANSSGRLNTSIGAYSMWQNTSGIENTSVGTNSLINCTTGSYNTSVGNNSLRSITTATSNTSIGCASSLNLTLGGYNVAVGRETFRTATTATNNVAIGAYASHRTTTGVSNVAVGRNALYNNTSGRENVAIGQQALNSATTASYNTAVGTQANYLLTSGVYNTSVGYKSGYNITTSSYNTVVGYQAFLSGNANSNTVVGYQASYNNTTGNSNTSVGYQVFYLNTTGTYNSSFGHLALRNNTTGNRNTAIGRAALYNNSTGEDNTAIGYHAGFDLQTGSNNLILGHTANASTNSVSGEITLGNSNILTLRCNVQVISSLSDLRDKKEIKNLKNAESFIKELRPVSFTWNQRDGGRVGYKDTGFIAQELLEAQVKAEHEIPNLVLENNPDKLEAAYAAMLPSVVSALQSALIKIEQLEQKINKL